MKIPLEISARGVDLTDALEDLIRDKASKLDTFYDGIIGCRVMVDVPHRSQRKGVSYNVRIDLTVPGSELIVKREPNEDLHASIVSSFDTAERKVKEFAEKNRGEVKVHIEKPLGRVTKIFPDDGYGFLMEIGSDGHEVYFHENAVLDGKFNELEAGSVVSFIERAGEEGPQASSVSLT